MIDTLVSTLDPLLSLAQLRGGGGGGAGAGGGFSSNAGGESLVLVSWWKPLVLFAGFVGWAWVVATIYDKDAARFYLGRRKWNLIHVVFAVGAIATGLLLPSFWIAAPAFLGILGADLVLYALKRNTDSRVPAGQKWSFDLDNIKQARADRQKEKLQRSVSLEFRGPAGLVAVPPRESAEYQIRVAAETVLREAVDARASRIDIAPAGDNGKYAMGLMVDGVRQMLDPLPSDQALAIIDFFKGASGLDIADRRRKLRADLGLEQAGGRRTLRITTAGGSKGVNLTILFDPAEQVHFNIDELGVLDSQMGELKSIIQESQGVVLVAAPPMNGRTATLYALLRAADPYTSNVQSIETEPAAPIEGVRQNVFDPFADAEYSTTVRSILRRDPDVVAVAELPDATTAIEISQADHERTRTYVGLRAENALVAVQTYLKAVGDLEKAATSLHGVIAQRLVRKLCLNCRVEYAPSPELLKKLGVPAGKVSHLYKKGGQVLIKNKPEVCPVCKGAGFFGQEGVFEIFVIDDDARAAIRAGDLAGLRSALRKKRLPSIQEASVQKAVRGLTSVEEVARVTSPPKKKDKAAATS